MSEPTPQPNNGSTALAKLLNQLNLPTLAMILMVGGGNWFATHQTSDEQRQDIYRAIRQINDLHRALDEFEDRQKDALSKADEVIRTQNKILEKLNK